MSWDEKKMEEQLDNYFKNTTKEQFLKDLEEASCLPFLENVEKN